MTDIYLPTFTGKRFNILDVKPEDICLLDIAHALSYEPRYNGHTRIPCTVAEHCVRLSYVVGLRDAAVALLHDAPEAYMKDLPRPLKVLGEFKFYRDLEDSVLTQILRQYVSTNGKDNKQSLDWIHKYDQMMSWVECVVGHVHPHPGVVPKMNLENDPEFKSIVGYMEAVFNKMIPWGWPQKLAKQAFVERALELGLTDESIEGGYLRNTKSLVLL